MMRSICFFLFLMILISIPLLAKSSEDPSSDTLTYPQHIGLLLPLGGPFAHEGRAVLNGFLSAYYQSLSGIHGEQVSIFDTYEKDIPSLYQEAVKQGVDCMVGPLTKDELNELANSRTISVPTLALNHSDNRRVGPNNSLFEFGLSPVDEIFQVVREARDEQHTHALIISPQKSWGEKLALTLVNEWQFQGGNVIAQMAYNEKTDLNKTISKLLNMDQSEKRYQNLKQILKEKIRFIPWRRNDFDVIFLLATSKSARQILPLLKFYYSGNVSVYWVSTTYSTTRKDERDHDLNGVKFNDMPWVLLNNDELNPLLLELRQQMESLWPAEFSRYHRLYALGIDAYHLLPYLNKRSSLHFEGSTGILSVDSQHRVYRELLPAIITEGKPHALLSESKSR